MFNEAFQERRTAPRLATALQGELASGQSLVSVRVADISAKGCSVVLVDRSGVGQSDLGLTGILHVSDPLGEAGSAILPVRLMAVDPARGASLIGLQFLAMSPRQAAKLDGLLVQLDRDQAVLRRRDTEVRSAWAYTAMGSESPACR